MASVIPLIDIGGDLAEIPSGDTIDPAVLPIPAAAITALTGDVTATGPGSVPATIANNAVTNAKLADVATATFKGRTTAGTGDPEDLTVAQAKALLNLTGTNSGDVTLGAVGASPNANAATLTGQVLNLQPASASFPGVITSAQFVVLNNTSGTNTGDQTITLTGDVTGSGTGSFAATIGANKVTFAKFQQIASDRLLGRDTAGTGNVEELTVGGGVEFTGSGGIQTSAFTGDVTKSAGGTAQTIANDAVTNAKLANMPTLTIKGNNTGGTADPIDLTVSQVNAMLGTTPGITALTGDVTASGPGSVAATIANNAVTYAKMQDIATDSLIGRDTAGTGDPETISLGASLLMNGSQQLQRAALTGDVTASANSNATTIPNDTVTYAKMQNVSATSRFLGRITAGAGDVEELTAANAKTILGYAASEVSFSPTGDISATTVQAAIAEMLSEAFPLGWGAWTAYVPTVTQGVTITTSGLQARYIRYGRLIIAQYAMTLTSAGTAGQTFVMAMPTSTVANGANGTARFFDTSAGVSYVLSAEANSASTAIYINDASGINPFGLGPAVTVGSGDVIRGQFIYEST